jgi:prepilin-type N-terminal cleavage/methylation domain-containing protein
MVIHRPRPRGRSSPASRTLVGSPAFTLIELLVVITIILIVSAVALPTVISGMSHRQVNESARILQAQIAGARDAAIRDNVASGIRLIPDPQFNGINPVTGKLDPTLPLAYNRIIPIQAAPNYSEGNVTVFVGAMPAAVANLLYPGPATPAIPNPTYGNTSALLAYQSVGTWQQPDPTKPYVFVPNPPTNWPYNIRVGDQIQINNAGPWLTIIGPMSVAPLQGNPEMFVNWGSSGLPSPLQVTIPSPDGQSITVNAEFLLLVNGVDDNKDGWVDSGWDGVDNDGKNGIDDIGEWIEIEAWPGALGGQGS